MADFALSWRGYQDNVVRGYNEVRALTDLEWQLMQPVFWAWLFIGVKDALARTTTASGPRAHHRSLSGRSPMYGSILPYWRSAPAH